MKPQGLAAAVLAAAFCFLLGLAIRRPCPEPTVDRDAWPQEDIGWEW